MTDHPWSSRVEPGAATHTPCCARPQSEHPGMAWEMVAAISAERDRLRARTHELQKRNDAEMRAERTQRFADIQAAIAVWQESAGRFDQRAKAAEAERDWLREELTSRQRYIHAELHLDDHGSPDRHWTACSRPTCRSTAAALTDPKRI